MYPLLECMSVGVKPTLDKFSTQHSILLILVHLVGWAKKSQSLGT